MNVFLIRHLRTAENVQRCYSGGSDPPLYDPPEQTPLPYALPVRRLVVAPAARTRETAARWFPRLPMLVEPDLAEMNFGRFAGQTAAQLAADAAYRLWVESGCATAVPGGDDPAAFTDRVALTFRRHAADGVGFVTHAGPIMAVLARFAGMPFFSLSVRPGQIVQAVWNGVSLTQVEVRP